MISNQGDFPELLPLDFLFRAGTQEAEPMPLSIAKTVSQLISRIEHFSNMKAAGGGQLSEDEYYFWVVPISRLWETVYDTAYRRQSAEMAALIEGRVSDHERGLSVLTAVLKKWPFPAIAGELTSVCLPPYDQNLLRKVFVEMLPALEIAADLLDDNPPPDVKLQMLMDHAGYKSLTPLNRAFKGEALEAVKRGKAFWYVYAELLPILRAKSNTSAKRWPPSVDGLNKKPKENSK